MGQQRRREQPGQQPQRSTYDQDHPVKRFREARGYFRTNTEVALRQWSDRAEPLSPVQCRLCREDVGFLNREEWLEHVNKTHGGLQRYRNALFSLLSLKPYVVRGQEWRACIANFSEFFSRAALDWEHFTPQMHSKAASDDGLGPDDRWVPRQRAACVFCCRLHWHEDLFRVFAASPHCFMANPSAVAELLSPER